MKNIFSIGLIVLLFISEKSFGQDCKCDYTIPENKSILEAGKDVDTSHMRTICIPAGTRGVLKIKNFQTSNSNHPYIFKNCGGKVLINASPSNGYGLSFENCKNFRVTGTGDKNTEYGIEVNGANNGMSIGAKSSDCEADHIYIHHAGFAGMMIKTDPKCDMSANYGFFTMKNVKVHDNKISDVAGEGFYIGNSFYGGFVPGKQLGPNQVEGYGYASCKDSTLYPHSIKNLRIYNNITHNTGREGIQIGCADEDVLIYRNTVSNYGISGGRQQNNGIQLGEGTTGSLYNNKIKDGHGHGIIVMPLGNIKIYNNQIIHAGSLCSGIECNDSINGIFVDNRSRTIPGSSIEVMHNTIVNSNRASIRIMSEITTNKVYNNILVGTGAGIKLEDKANADQNSNYIHSNISTVNFKNPENGDYHLKQTSNCCINNGTNNEVKIDYDQSPRPSGKGIDIGAYEYLENSKSKNSNSKLARKRTKYKISFSF